MSESTAILDEIKKVNEKVQETFEQFRSKDKEIEEAIQKRDASIQELLNNFNKINDDITEQRKVQNKLNEQLEEVSLRSQRPNLNNRSTDEQAHVDKKTQLALRKLLNTGDYRKLSEDEAKLLYPEGAEEAHKRSMNEDSDSKGGVLAPAILENQIVKAAYDLAAIRPYADTKTISSKEAHVPTMGAVTTSWGTEESTYVDQDINTGLVKVTIHKLKGLVKISEELLEDSTADLFSELGQAFGEAMAEAEDDAYCAGNGVNQPFGLFSNAEIKANYVFSGVAGALNDSTHNGADTLIDALFTKIRKYKRNATWLMNSITEAAVRKFKDGQGQYLWQPSIQVGSPTTILGRPLANPEGAPDIAANAYPIVVGDLKKYAIRDRRGIIIQRLVELYAATGQVAFKVSKRTGGNVLLPEAFASVKVATS